jgi:hypothetical protein
LQTSVKSILIHGITLCDLFHDAMHQGMYLQQIKKLHPDKNQGKDDLGAAEGPM